MWNIFTVLTYIQINFFKQSFFLKLKLIFNLFEIQTNLFTAPLSTGVDEHIYKMNPQLHWFNSSFCWLLHLGKPFLMGSKFILCKTFFILQFDRIKQFLYLFLSIQFFWETENWYSIFCGKTCTFSMLAEAFFPPYTG